MRMKRIERARRIGCALALLCAGCVDKVEVGRDIDAGVDIGELPARPDAATSSASDAMELVFALRDLHLLQSAGAEWSSVGLDLDGFDTNEPDSRGDCAGIANTGDGIDGIDNQLGGTLWPIIEARLPTLDCEFEAAMAEGYGTLILVVENYNGDRDDAEVTISMTRSVDGTSGVADCARFESGERVLLDGPAGSGASPAPAPDWIGAPDEFCTNPNDFVGPEGAPILRDVNGYISNGRLVMSMAPGGDIPLQTHRQTVRIKLNQAHLLATLSEDLSSVTDGVIAGRWALTTITQDIVYTGICDPSVLVDTFTAFADILSSPEVEPTGDLHCDALSVGIPFIGQAAVLAGRAPEESGVPDVLNCDASGPTAVLIEPWPTQTCCAAFDDLSDIAGCESYWNPI